MTTSTENKRESYRFAWLLLPLAVAWIVPGLFGHEPWKPDEGYTIGMVKNIFDTGDWIVPRLAGEPFMEKPPVFFLTAALMGRLFSPWLMPLHQAMALAAALYVGVAFLFVFLGARETRDERVGATATLTLMGCVGFLYRGHSAITDTALWAGFAIACYGVLLARRRLFAGAFWFGTGAGLAFMAKGLLGPGILGLATFLLPVLSSEWRNARFAKLVVWALVFSLPWVLIWPLALYRESPELFNEWFIGNNVGRFLGSSYGFDPHVSSRGHLTYIVRFPWFCLPLWIPAVALFARNGRAAWRSASIAFPVLIVLVGLTVLTMASGQREVYFIPMLVPLAILAAFGFRDIPVRLKRILTALPAVLATAALAILWGVWACWRFGLSDALDRRMQQAAPGLEEFAGTVPVAAAVVYTILWCVLLFTRNGIRREWDWLWAAGFTAVWGVLFFLYMPAISRVKGYEGTFAEMMTHLPAERPLIIEGSRVGEPQRALLDYYFDVRIRQNPGDAPEEKRGAYLLEQNERHKTGRNAHPGEEWKPLWEGGRPGDKREWFVLYER